MIPFWIMAALITVAVVAVLVRPLLREAGSETAGAPMARADYDRAVYRDQLAEIERDLARGVIEAGQADAARLEINRRLLATVATEEPAAQAASAVAGLPVSSGRGDRRLALGLVLGFPVAALGLYLGIGRPDLPAQPWSEQRVAAALAAEQRAAPPNIVAAVAHLAENLKAHPEDMGGWVLLAQSLDKLGRSGESLEAWRKAASLAPEDAEIQGNYAEALIAGQDGLVSKEARRCFEAVLAHHPGDPRARFFLALAQAQGGDFQGAAAGWRALLADSPADAPWVPMVRERLTDVAGRLGVASDTLLPPTPTPTPTQAPAAAPPDDRAQMIRTMVSGLAARLEANPADLGGWLRLAKSYEVLGETEAAARAVARAREQALSETIPVTPDTAPVLGFLAEGAASQGDTTTARALWRKLLSSLKPDQPGYAETKARLDALK